MGREKEQILAVIQRHVAYEDVRQNEAQAYVDAGMERMPNGFHSMTWLTVVSHRKAALEKVFWEIRNVL